MLRSETGAKGRRLVSDVDQKLWVVSEDAVRVTQILINLLSNAHTYTPPGGSITVQVRGKASRVRFEVQDMGIGLCPEDQAHLLTPFFRAQNHTV